MVTFRQQINPQTPLIMTPVNCRKSNAPAYAAQFIYVCLSSIISAVRSPICSLYAKSFPIHSHDSTGRAHSDVQIPPPLPPVSD